MPTPTTYPVTIERNETDFTQRASISTLINRVLCIAGLDADAKGFGVGELNEDNHTWVLSRFAIEVDYLPKAYDKIDITTWISDYRRLISTRCFEITNPEGVSIGGAVSQWCMLDIKLRKAVDLSQLHGNYAEYVLGEHEPTIDRPRKIAQITPSSSLAHRVAYSDVDFNGHMNSLRYIDLMLDILPLDMLKQHKALRVDLQYAQECYHGEELAINYEQQGEVSVLEILKGDGSAAVRCSIEWRG